MLTGHDNLIEWGLRNEFIDFCGIYWNPAVDVQPLDAPDIIAAGGYSSTQLKFGSGHIAMPMTINR